MSTSIITGGYGGIVADSVANARYATVEWTKNLHVIDFSQNHTTLTIDIATHSIDFDIKTNTIDITQTRHTIDFEINTYEIDFLVNT
jgi:rRNA processing protein Krr1/Pno1